MRRYGELSRGAERSSPLRFFPDWTIATRGYDFREGQGDRDAEFEQFAMNLGRAPQRVLKTHSLDQLAHLSGDPRPAPGRAGFPSPVAGKTLAMPAYDS